MPGQGLQRSPGQPGTWLSRLITRSGKGKKMRLWTILIAVLLVVLIAGLVVFRVADMLIRSLNDEPMID